MRSIPIRDAIHWLVRLVPDGIDRLVRYLVR